jgi:hypothetical protein
MGISADLKATSAKEAKLLTDFSYLGYISIPFLPL